MPDILGVWFSGSRGGFFAFFALIVLVFSARWFRNLVPGILTIIILLAASFILSLNEKTTLGMDQREVSTAQRLYLFGKAWDAFTKSPLIGVGDLQIYIQKNLDVQELAKGLTQKTVTHAHNLIFQTIGESGLLGLSTLIFLWASFLFIGKTEITMSSLILLLLIILFSLFDFLYFFPPIQIAFWIAGTAFVSDDVGSTCSSISGLRKA